MEELLGCGAAAGCARGIAKRLSPQKTTVERRSVENAEAEAERLEAVREEYLQSLQELMKQEGQAEDAVAILDAYQEILQDETFFAAVRQRTIAEHVNIDYAIREEEQAVAAQFALLDDEYLMERANDIANVCNQLICRLQGTGDNLIETDGDGRKCIIFAEDLTPDQTLRMDRSTLGGFVTEKGGLTSHTVILAKTLGIPAVVGVSNALSAVKDGQDVIVYGDSGKVVLSPDAAACAAFAQEESAQQALQDAYQVAAAKPAVTPDGVRVKVCVNIGDWRNGSDLDALETCDGVGLYRTEFLYMRDDGYPSEEEQFQFYRAVAERAGQNEVIIRTLDIGGDKQASYMDMPQESNPFLGYRAIRLCLDRTDVFRTQLRAILRASAYGNVAIMFPMIASVEELRQAKEVLAQARGELDREGIPYRPDFQVGIMVETPAAVQISDLLARESDFFSIGTNDLIQYTMAADRMNDRVQYLYNVCSPAVLRSVDAICRGAAASGIPVNMCGEAASDPMVIPMWIAMGLSELSVVPSQVARTKYMVNHLSAEEVRKWLPGVLSCATVEQVQQRLREIQTEFGLTL